MQPLPLKECDPRFYAFARYLCQIGCLLAFRLRVFGRHNVPRHGGVLLASNHQSFLDPVLVGVGLPRQVHFMARETLFRTRAFGRLIRMLNAFPIRRGESDRSAIREAIRRLRSGAALVVFPEGTRTRDGSIGPIRPGIFAIASRAGAPIVPVVIDGAFDAWPRHSKLIRPAGICIQYGPPILPSDDRNLPTLVASRMAELQAHLRSIAR